MGRSCGLSLLFIVFCFASPVQANLPPETAEPLKISVDEILSLPGGNRLLVAASRAKDLLPELEKIAFSKERDYNERWKAVVLYTQLAGPEAHLLLSKSLKSSEWFMRNAALVAYQEVLPGRAANVARELLTDKALVVRSAAIQVLEMHMSSEVRELLWAEIDQPRNFRKKQSLWTRPQILEILAKNPNDRELPLYVASLREKDERMHAPAIVALEQITQKKLAPHLKDLVAKRELWLKWVKSDSRTKDM